MVITFTKALFHNCLNEGNEGNVLKEMVDGRFICLDYFKELSREEQASPNFYILGVPFSNILSFLREVLPSGLISHLLQKTPNSLCEEIGKITCSESQVSPQLDVIRQRIVCCADSSESICKIIKFIVNPNIRKIFSKVFKFH